MALRQSYTPSKEIMAKTKLERTRIGKGNRSRLNPKVLAGDWPKSCGQPPETVTHHPSDGWNTLKCRRAFSPQTAVFSVVSGRISKNSLAEGHFSPNCSEGGLAFQSQFAIIQVTHSPCRSRYAVTHIKGEFFYWAPPKFRREESR